MDKAPIIEWSEELEEEGDPACDGMSEFYTQFFFFFANEFSGGDPHKGF
jgi:hypothetical protein